MFPLAVATNKTLWVVLGIAASVVISHGAVYFYGSHKGAASVQVKWDKDTQARDKVIADLRVDVAKKETDYKAETKRLEGELLKSGEEHVKNLAAIERDYTKRLRTSETRSAIYKRQSEGGAAERERLADHAAALDKSLEEGRSLVRELGAALGQRERELNLLMKQVQNEQRTH